MTIHVVQHRQSLEGIAALYGVDPRRLAADNQVEEGRLAVGQTLVIRFPRQIHAVSPGQTLAAIARQYGLSLRQLWRRNFSLGGGSLIYPGEDLVISYLEQTQGSAFLNGYAYPFIQSQLLSEQLPYTAYLAPFTYGISQTGGLLPLQDAALLANARQHGSAAVMHLSTLTESGQFSTQRAQTLLADETAQEALIAQVLDTVRYQGFAGVDVDLEYLPGTLAGAYAAFLARLRRELTPIGRFLWAALAPKTASDQKGLLYEGHDYAAIGAAVDAALLMTYEWGYTYGPPMAVAPLPNVRAVLDYAVTQIPPEKLMLGIPNYGYDWPLPFTQGETRAQSISNRQAIALAIQYDIAIQYDETAQAPFFHYTAPDGVVHEVWFEDARSLYRKLQLLAEYGFPGAGVWNLMRPFSQLWLLADALYTLA